MFISKKSVVFYPIYAWQVLPERYPTKVTGIDNEKLVPSMLPWIRRSLRKKTSKQKEGNPRNPLIERYVIFGCYVACEQSNLLARQSVLSDRFVWVDKRFPSFSHSSCGFLGEPLIHTIILTRMGSF